MNSKDIRNVLSIAKLVHSIDDILWLVQTYKKYGRIPGGIDNSYGDPGLMNLKFLTEVTGRKDTN